MVKISSKKFLATTTLLTIFVILTASLLLLPNASAKDATNVIAEGRAIINQVPGLNLTYYDVSATLADANGSYLGVLPTENIHYILSGLGNTIEIQDTFTNGNLLMMTVLDDTRSTPIHAVPPEVQSRLSIPNVTVRMAKTFLLNYQNYSASSFYGQLAATLDNADITKNSTTNIGHLNFEINAISENSTLNNTTTFTWSYTANGVDAKCKCVSLSFKNGFLDRFFDSWNLYQVGSTSVNISQQQAEAIAMQSAETYTWTIGSANSKDIINNFNVTKPVYAQLAYYPTGNGANARNSNPLTLYPMWGIGIDLDKYYPGNVYGIYVSIWADTGNIISTQEVSSSLDPPANATVATIAESSISIANNPSDTKASLDSVLSLGALAASAVVAMIFTFVWLNRKTFSVHLKLRKLGRSILCILVVSMLLTIALASPTVSAGGSGLIWGNNSNGSNNTLYHSPSEIGNQSMIATYIYNLFQSCGYSNPVNAQGSQTTPQYFSSILSNAYNYYPPIAAVYFDHGIGLTGVISGYPNEFHYMLDGSTAVYGNPSGDIFDYQIFDLTSTSKNYFCYISTCLSADLNNPSALNPAYTGHYGANNGAGESTKVIGMPYAWTHGASMSTNGYYNPDNGAYCYIGFPWGSAPLAQTAPPLNSNYPNIYYGEFVSDFFYAALSLHYSVNQALDYASGICWGGQSFQNTVLYSGFAAFWPKNSTDTYANDPQNLIGSCTMTVYGNGNMYLYPGSPDSITSPSISNNVPYPGVTSQQYQFSATATDPCGYSLTYDYNYGDGSGWTTATTHTYTSPNVYTVTARAHSSTGLTRQSSTSVTIGNILSVYASVGGWIELYPNVQVDGNSVGTAPISVPVTSSSHTVTVDDPTQDSLVPGYYDSFSCFIGSDNNYYYNGQSIQITSPMTLYAYYNWGY